MKKLAAATIAATTLFAAVPSSQAAGSVTQGVTVQVNLTAACAIQNGTGFGSIPNPVVDFGTYTAFQTSPVTATVTPATFTVHCTRGLTAPTYSFDGGTGYGVIAGLNYQVTASHGAVAPGTLATATAGGIGSGDKYTVTLAGTMAADQAGAGTGGAATATRTLTISY